jgi:bilirubin oxidase
MDEDGEPEVREWKDAITENPALGSTEVWEIYNFTADAHPIHIHEVEFEVVNRQPFEGSARAPEVWEGGFKDTVIAYPEEITRVKAHFDLPGLYVWHCHIVEHEDNEMMRPYFIGP